MTRVTLRGGWWCVGSTHKEQTELQTPERREPKQYAPIANHDDTTIQAKTKFKSIGSISLNES